ncbi:MAG: autotransporter domain-containing protein, partial [Candidatus Accumulibacter sp.]|nr:autotransporter domain-containing protein [Accumulibacter sp.]
ATHNTVILRDNAKIENATWIQGGTGSIDIGSDFRTGNLLHIENWRGTTKANIENFATYRFTLLADVANGQSILALTSSGYVALGNDARIEVDFAGRPTALRLGDTVHLLDATASTGVIDGSLANTTAVTSPFGATDYLFDIALDDLGGSDNELLTATLKKTQVKQEKAAAYLYGGSARLASLVAGADHLLGLLDEARPSTATPARGPHSFASLRGESFRTRTGSHIKDRGASLLLGGEFAAENRLGALSLGFFAEGGVGNYDSYKRFVRGDGDTWHAGAGLFARQRLARGFHLEASLRGGRAKTDFAGKGSARDLRYDSKGSYWGGHLGAGHSYPLNETASVESYFRLLWTRQQSDTVKTRAGEKLAFAQADSLRSRLGTRYRYEAGQGLRAYAGLGWEYESDGKTRARLDGTKIDHAPAAQGHSALLEAGAEWTAAKRWRLAANLTAMSGQRKGAGGFLQASYLFDRGFGEGRRRTVLQAGAARRPGVRPPFFCPRLNRIGRWRIMPA